MERFEQSQSVISRIQQILREYPYGDAVLLELLQNADDATATTVSVTLEDFAARTHHPAAKSPALVFCNNSIFTERDLANIQSIGGDENSTKRHDGTKVGRFGVGFNSAYHVADVIAFVSDSTLVVFDPCRENLPAENGQHFGGGRWDFVKASTDADKPRSEEAAFVDELLTAFELTPGLFFSRTAPFKGTIFRLPLREKPSKLWREVHPAEDLRRLVEGFDTAARLGLVLLKNVIRVTAVVASAPEASSVLFSVAATVAPQQQAQKKRILKWLQDYTDVMKAVAENCDAAAPRPSADFFPRLPVPLSLEVVLTVEADNRDSGKKTTTLFSVTHQLGPSSWVGSQCWKIAEECARYHHPISVPWSGAIVENGDAVAASGGRLMCFFPIRQSTGLPLHIHAYFQLSSDRQSVLAVERSSWNSAMCLEVVPYAYCNAVLALTLAGNAAKPPESHYNMWPSKIYTDTTIARIAENTLRIAYGENSILTPQGVQTAASAIFLKPRLSPSAMNVLSKVAMHIAIAAGKECALGQLIDEEDPLDELLDAFTRLKLHCAIADSRYFRTELSKRRSTDPLSKETAIELFSRCTDDENFAEFAAAASLDVVPLESGKGSRLKNSTGNPFLLLAEDSESYNLARLLFHTENRLVARFDPTVQHGATVTNRLDALCKFQHILLFTSEVLFDVLCTEELDEPAFQLLPSQDLVLVPSPKSRPGKCIPVHVLAEYFLRKHHQNETTFLATLPLLPEKHQWICPVSAASPHYVCALNVEEHVCFAVDCPVDQQSEDVQVIASTLLACGARLVDSSRFPVELLRSWRVNDHHLVSVISSSITQSAQMVLVALARLLESKTSAKLRAMLQTPSTAAAFLRFMMSGLEHLSVAECTTLASLPIFPTVWGTCVPVTGTDGNDEVFHLSKNLNPKVVALVRRTEIPGIHVIEIGNCAVFETFLKHVPVNELPDVVATALVMRSLAPPTSSSQTAEEADGNTIWSEFCALLSQLRSSKSAYPALLEAAMEPLRKHPLLLPSSSFCSPGADTPPRVAPQDCVNTDLLPEPVCEMLSYLHSVRRETCHVPFVPDLTCIPQQHRTVFCEELHVASFVTLQMLRDIAATFDLIPDNLRDINHSFVLLHLIDEADGLTADDIRAIQAMRFVPTAPDDSDAGVLFVTPAEVTDRDIFNILPTGSRRPIHDEALLSPSPRTGRCGLPQCSSIFLWNAAPSVESVVSYINSCRQETQGASNIWASYSFLEDILAEKRKGAVLGAKSFHHDTAAFIQQHLEGLYFPEEKTFFERWRLATSDSHASGVLPWLACITPVFHQRFSNLVKALRLPLNHTVEAIVTAMEEIVAQECEESSDASQDPQQTSSPQISSTGPIEVLTVRGRQKLIAALEYLVEAHETEALRLASGRGIEVPTSDGWWNLSNKVVYDFYSFDVQQPSRETLHADVHAQTARRLGMAHTGTKVIENLHRAHLAASVKFEARGQRHSLINAIKRILGDYSDPHSIVMEMLQNADDAGAREYKLYLDTRSHSTEPEGLLGTGMAACQGPALLVYNDKTFAPSDVDALMEIGCGHKAKDKLSIGRFGVGFNTVYHITDCPALVTGDTTLFLDPSAKHLDGVSSENPGLIIHNKENPKLAQIFPAQFEPFLQAPFSVDFNKTYPATLFRLPIRTKPTEVSISSRKWSIAEVRKMLQDFTKIMPNVLIFLKHVLKISVYEIGSEGETTLMAMSEVSNRNAVADFRAELSECIASGDSAVAHTLMSVLFHPACGEPPTPHDWLVSAVVKTAAEGPRIDSNEADHRRKLVPSAAVAIRLDTSAFQGPPRTDADNHQIFLSAPFMAEQAGLMHCFLPMPGIYGLPFHVQGCFALFSDRRSMSLSSTIEGSESWEVIWNRHVLADLVPTALEAAFRHRANQIVAMPTSAVAQYYETWPIRKGTVSEQLAFISSGFCDLLLTNKTPCLWSLDETLVEPEVASCATSAAFEAGGCDITTKISARAVLLLTDKKVCCCPPEHLYALQAASKRLSLDGPVELSPQQILSTLVERASVCSLRSMPSSILLPAASSEAEVLQTLVEVLLYLRPLDGSGANIVVLENAPLVLLRDCSIGIVHPSRLFLTPDCLTHAEALFSLFVPAVIHQDFFKRLSDLGFKDDSWQLLNVSPLKIENLSRLLGMHFTAEEDQHLGRKVEWDGIYDSERGRWLAAIWRFIWFATDKGRQVLDDAQLMLCERLAAWPLIPTQQDSRKVLVPLTEAKLVFCGNLEEASDALNFLGVRTLDPECPFADVVRRTCKVEDAEGQKISDVLESANNMGRFANMSATQRENLLVWLLRQNKSSLPHGFFGLEGPLTSLIRSLPLFEVYQSASGVWSFQPAPRGVFLLPAKVPVSSASDGLYRMLDDDLRDQCTTIRLLSMPVEKYFLEKVLPTIERGHMTTAQELEHLRIIGQESVLLQSKPLRELLRKTCFIPGEQQFYTSTRDLIDTSLRAFAIDFIMKHSIDFREKCAENEELLLRLQVAEARCFDSRKRYLASDVLLPFAVKAVVKFPNVLTLLMKVYREGFTKIFVSSLLWADPHIRKTLQVTVAEQLPRSKETDNVIMESVRAFGRICSDLLPEVIRASGRLIASKSDVHRLVREISVSIGQVALEMGSEDCKKSLCDIPFLASGNLLDEERFPATFEIARGEKDSPLLFCPAEMCHQEFAFVCWTQRPLVAKELAALPIPKPTFETVLAHLQCLATNRCEGALELLDRALRQSYTFLAIHCAEDVRKSAALILGMPVLVLPESGPSRKLLFTDSTAAPCPRFTSINRVIDSRRVGRLEPFFYQLEEFDKMPEAGLLIRQIRKKEGPSGRQVTSLPLPFPQDVVAALLQSANAWDSLPSLPEERMEAVQTHVELLKLLVFCSIEHSVRLVFASLHSGSPLDSRTRHEVALTENISQIRVPTTSGEMVPITSVVCADAPHLLRRLRRGALHIAHQSVPLYILRRLGASSIVTVVMESPVAVTPLCLQDRREDLSNAFFRSHAFARGLARVLASEQRDEAARDSATGSTGRNAPLLTSEESRSLKIVKVRFVESATVAMLDSRNPAVDIGGSQESPNSCLDRHAMIIYICMKPQKQAFAGRAIVDPSYLIALELNNLLNNKIRNLAPLSCVFRHAIEHPGCLEQTGQLLDTFGCSELSTGYAPGDPVTDVALLRFGRCSHLVDQEFPVSRLRQRCVAILDDETALVTWMQPEKEMTGVFVEFPEVF
jgi:hypothetical protein